MARFAINGFGRIGRNILRAAIKRGARDFDVVLLNDVDKPKTLAHLFKYDSVHGIFDGTVEATEDAVVINGKKIGSAPSGIRASWRTRSTASTSPSSARGG